jgi:membrane protein
MASKIIKIKEYWKETTRFAFHDMWAFDLDKVSKPKGLIVRILRVGVLVARGFRNDDLPVHASALTFATVMSLIPILAIVFSVLQGIGAGGDHISDLLEWTHDMPPQFQAFIERIIEVARQTNFAALGGIGLITLLVFATMVLSNIENSFNRIWGITKFRNPIRRIVNYIGIIAVVPVLIALSGTVSAFLNSPTIFNRLGTVSFLYTFLLSSLPYLMMWLAFCLLYIVLPNTQVRVKPAMLASLIGAIALLAWQSVYIDFQLGVARRNAIYGTFASIPIFLAWLYISWVIVLLGAKLAFAMQNESTFHIEGYSQTASLGSRVTIALAILTRCGEALETDVPPFDVTQFAEEHRAPVRLLNEVCRQLVTAGWLTERAERPGSFALLKAPELIKVREVFDALLYHGASPKQLGIEHLSIPIDETMRLFDEGISDILKDRTLEDMMGSLSKEIRE